MTREEYVRRLLDTYFVVHVLSDKADHRVLHLRHREQGRDLIVRSFQKPIAAYEALCRYECENLPIVYDVLQLDDGQIVLEEFVEGNTLSDVLLSVRYRYRDAKKVLQGVCNALTLLHEQGLVHRDVKPENIVIGQDERVVLIDLNASRQLSSSKKDTVIMGTVGYVSPEQLGLSQSDPRTNIYAAGVLLNVMLTGKHPSEKKVGGKAGHIVHKCTNVSPDERYQSAEKLSKAL